MSSVRLRRVSYVFWFMVRIVRELDIRDENLKLGFKLFNEGFKRGKNMGFENKVLEVFI